MGSVPLSSLSSNSQSAQFLLAEFNERSQDRRLAESQTEHVLDLYLTVCTILVPGAAALWRFSTVSWLPATAAALVAIALATAGIFLTGRILAADIMAATYSRALCLVRRYFVNSNPEVAKYLRLPVATSLAELDHDETRSLYTRRHFMLVNVLRVWSSLLWGAGTALLVQMVLPVGITVCIGIAVLVGSYVGILLLTRHWKEEFIDSIKKRESGTEE